MHATNRTSYQAVPLLAAIVIATAIAAFASAAAEEPKATRVLPGTSTQASMVGAATGETVNGVAVYRLPPITITVSRKVELAKIAQEEAIARAKADHANVAAKAPPARPAQLTLASRSTQK